jgi:hypothetical protein
MDNHGQGGDTGAPHDPATYVAFAKNFAGYAAQIAPGISIGIDAGDPYGYNNWIPSVLQNSAAQGFTPGFLSDHLYVQTAGSENDSYLLESTFSNPSSLDNWVTRGAAYRQELTQYLGAAGSGVSLLATEFNSVNTNAGKQTTSLVNGLAMADSLGVLLNSPYVGADIWELRGRWKTGNNNSPSLYGWRQGGDYGLLGDPIGPPPSTGPYIPYPTYFAEQLASKIIQIGGKVVQASSDDPSLSVYAVHQASGHLSLMVINKNPGTAETANFQLSGFAPASQAQVWQYGEAEDTAQSQTTDGHSSLSNLAVTLTISGSSFSDTFPAYSMTVLDLAPGP